jgi:hypothetical protein
MFLAHLQGTRGFWAQKAAGESRPGQNRVSTAFTPPFPLTNSFLYSLHSHRAGPSAPRPTLPGNPSTARARVSGRTLDPISNAGPDKQPRARAQPGAAARAIMLSPFQQSATLESRWRMGRRRLSSSRRERTQPVPPAPAERRSLIGGPPTPGRVPSRRGSPPPRGFARAHRPCAWCGAPHPC